MMYQKAAAFFLVLVSLGFTSCTKSAPEACISIQQRVTTFYVGEQVQFQASCSKNAADYKWSIGKPGNYQSYQSPTVKVKFEKEGNYEVKLSVGNSQQSDAVSLIVQVIAQESGE